MKLKKKRYRTMIKQSYKYLTFILNFFSE